MFYIFFLANDKMLFFKNFAFNELYWVCE